MLQDKKSLLIFNVISLSLKVGEIMQENNNAACVSGTTAATKKFSRLDYSKSNAENQSAKENFQILPAKLRHDSNDKITKTIFNPKPAQVEKGKMKIAEKDAVTNISFNAGIRFSAFNKEVLNACTSQFVEGNDIISVNMIFRLMTGYKREPKSATIHQAIINSLNRLISVQFTIDASQLCTKLKYNNGKPYIYKGALLPAQIIDNAIIRGQSTTAIKIIRIPPLYEIASLKHKNENGGGQILTFPVDLLNVPKTRNSLEEIIIKNHTIRRILENNHQQMSNIITFDEILQSTGFTDLTKSKLQDTRQYTEMLLDYWQQKNIIADYKQKFRFKKYYGIEIYYH